MSEQKFTLLYGLEFEGAYHREASLRLPTLEDVEWALDNNLSGASDARMNRYVWSRTITSLGTIPKEAITPGLLAQLIDQDFGIIVAAEADLRKKRQGASAPESASN